MKRLLYFTLDWGRIIPQEKLWKAALAHHFDVTFYGPGYVPYEDMIWDANAVFKTLGGFDYVLYDSSANTAHIRFIATSPPSAYQILNFDIGPYLQKSRFMLFENWKELPVPTILDLASLDPWSFRKTSYDECFESFHWIIFFNKHQIARLPEEASSLHTISAHYIQRQNHIRKLAERYHHRLIPFCHHIDNKEFDGSPLQRRPFDASVLGTAYPRRKSAYASLSSLDLICAPRLSGQLARALLKLGLPRRLYYNICTLNLPWGTAAYALKFCRKLGIPFHRKAALWILRKSYQYRLKTTKTIYADGTDQDHIVRKFFEYPAAGAVMCASPAYNFEQYGFKDGINYIRCDAANYARVARDILRDEKRSGEIAEAGRKLVEEKFHADVYVRFAAEAFERIRNGRYRGAHLENGDWIFD